MSGIEKTEQPSILEDTIRTALEELERSGDIVICSTTPNLVTEFLNSRLQILLPNNTISPSELVALRCLLHHAISDKRFFDWEMPTLTGLTAEEFAKLAGKLPTG
jgi:hypothetical protein